MSSTDEKWTDLSRTSYYELSPLVRLWHFSTDVIALFRGQAVTANSGQTSHLEAEMKVCSKLGSTCGLGNEFHNFVS